MGSGCEEMLGKDIFNMRILVALLAIVFFCFLTPLIARLTFNVGQKNFS
jgi:hypothetical protein